MNSVKVLTKLLDSKDTNSGVVRKVERGQIVVSTNRGAVITVPNSQLTVNPGDRVAISQGVIIDKISEQQDKPTYLV